MYALMQDILKRTEPANCPARGKTPAKAALALNLAANDRSCPELFHPRLCIRDDDCS